MTTELDTTGFVRSDVHMTVTTARHAVPRGSLADRARHNINRRLRELRRNQKWAAEQLGITQQSVSDRASGRVPWRLNEIEQAAITLEMDLTSILAPVDGDTSFHIELTS